MRTSLSAMKSSHGFCGVQRRCPVPPLRAAAPDTQPLQPQGGGKARRGQLTVIVPGQGSYRLAEASQGGLERFLYRLGAVGFEVPEEGRFGYRLQDVPETCDAVTAVLPHRPGQVSHTLLAAFWCACCFAPQVAAPLARSLAVQNQQAAPLSWCAGAR
jgi:hypothetical protein